MTRITRISCAVICIAVTLVILNGKLQAAGPRNWTNKEGKKIHASFVDLVVKEQDGTESEIVILERSSDERRFEIPLKLLSELDQTIARKYLKHADRKKRKQEAQPKAEQASNRNTPKNGLRTRRYKNGQKKFEYHYKNGKLDGLYTYWGKDGQKRKETHYKDGKQDGLQTSWHENGQKRWEYHYKNGEQNGLQTRWYENGQKLSEGQMSGGGEMERQGGNPDGLWTYWDENGNKTKHVQYKDGKKDGFEIELHENGQKRLEVYWHNEYLGSAASWKSNGEPCPITKFVDGSGTVVSWYENGQKRQETHYKDGKQDGLQTYWGKDGDKWSETEYEDGSIVNYKEFLSGQKH